MFLTREQCQELDHRVMTEFAVPGIVLMENAGRGMAELLRSFGASGPVAVCCGKGNNGGDGFVIARHLDNAGVAVRVFVFADPDRLASDAAINFEVLVRSGLALEVYPGPNLADLNLDAELRLCDWVVDALFGVGLRGPVQAPFDQVIRAINACPARVLAVDVPSGLDVDTGRPLGPTVRAHHTATVAALKKGFAAPEAHEWTGEVHVIDMGAPRRALRIS
jgi:NAD(P)H-hydrate epimerase